MIISRDDQVLDEDAKYPVFDEYDYLHINMLTYKSEYAFSIAYGDMSKIQHTQNLYRLKLLMT